MRGGTLQVSIPLAPVIAFAEADNHSLSTISTTSTATDLPGPGRIIDKYIYQVVGKMIERCAGRIAMSSCFVTAYAIFSRIIEVWGPFELEGPCQACNFRKPMHRPDKIRFAIAQVEKRPSGSFILSGIRELINRLRSVTDCILTTMCSPDA